MAADYKTLYGLVREFTERLSERSANTDDIQDLMQRARAAVEPSKPKNDPAILHSAQPDKCCTAPFQKAAKAGELDAATKWTCPKCGTEWKVVASLDTVRRWDPVVNVAVVRR